MNILHKIGLIARGCSENTSKVFNGTFAFMTTGGVLAHGVYAYGTRGIEQQITVASKYQIYNSTGTDFAVNTTNGKQYLIPFSFWYWQFDVPEKWANLEVGKTYNIKTYGMRIPYLGFFPNIIDVSKHN